MKERCEISKVNKSIGGNKRIGGTFCWKLIKEWSLISAYRQDFFSFSNKRPVRLFGTLEYVPEVMYWNYYMGSSAYSVFWDFGKKTCKKKTV